MFRPYKRPSSGHPLKNNSINRKRMNLWELMGHYKTGYVKNILKMFMFRIVLLLLDRLVNKSMLHTNLLREIGAQRKLIDSD
jgi:hypothetical protein